MKRLVNMPTIFFGLILLAFLLAFFLGGTPSGTLASDISIEEYPYQIVVYEEGLYRGTYLVKDYEVMAGGIAFEGYWRCGRATNFSYYEQETIYTGCRFDITERAK